MPSGHTESLTGWFRLLLSGIQRLSSAHVEERPALLMVPRNLSAQNPSRSLRSVCADVAVGTAPPHSCGEGGFEGSSLCSFSSAEKHGPYTSSTSCSVT